MKISKISGADQGTIIDAVYRRLCDSRFTAEVTRDGFKNIKVAQVRLREKKAYCGNHPKACENAFGRHAKAAYLEGADWVEFNDLLNDVLDELRVAAKVESRVVNLRLGTQRRVKYDGNNFVGNAWQWDKFGPEWHYECGFGKTMGASKFPFGTPGIHTKIDYNCVG